MATVIDLASRRVVGWALADHMESSLVCEAMRVALLDASARPGAHFPFRSRQSIYVPRVPPAIGKTPYDSKPFPPCSVLGQQRG